MLETVSSAFSSFFCPLRNCCSRCFWRSLSLALNGDGLLNLKLVTIEGWKSPLRDEEEVGFISEALVEELRLGLMTTLLLVNRLLDLPPPNDVEELKDPLDELPKAGDDGVGEAGVAINVGVTSLLVMIATVVRVRDVRDLPLVLRVGLKILGLITGVNVRLGRVNVKRDAPPLEEPLIELL